MPHPTSPDTPSEQDQKLQKHVRELLLAVGEDPDREGLLSTPKRFLSAFRFLTGGYNASIEKLINNAIFEAPYSEMVIVKNIEFYSVCEHHLVPFFGRCHVGYLPRGKILGLSKIPRIVDAYARRLQVQERLTSQISECLMTHLNPLGVGVVMEAQHLCMMMRGVEKQASSAQTSSLLGDFQKAPTRQEFFNLIK